MAIGNFTPYVKWDSDLFDKWESRFSVKPLKCTRSARSVAIFFVYKCIFHAKSGASLPSLFKTKESFRLSKIKKKIVVAVA